MEKTWLTNHWSDEISLCTPKCTLIFIPPLLLGLCEN